MKFNAALIILSFPFVITACGGGGSSSNSSTFSSGSDIEPTYPEVLTEWVINNSTGSANILDEYDAASSGYALVNVQSVTSDDN